MPEWQADSKGMHEWFGLLIAAGIDSADLQQVTAVRKPLSNNWLTGRLSGKTLSVKRYLHTDRRHPPKEEA